MAFTFDADPASATMNSYITVADADDYFSSRYGSTAWADLDDSTKQAVLVHATRQLNLFEYGGIKTSRIQPLKWPRTSIYDTEGTVYPSTVLPVQMKQATCEQADWILTESERTLPDVTLGQFTDFKAGPLTLKIRNNPLSGISAMAIKLIKSIGPSALYTATGSGPVSMSMKL